VRARVALAESRSYGITMTRDSSRDDIAKVERGEEGARPANAPPATLRVYYLPPSSPSYTVIARIRIVLTIWDEGLASTAIAMEFNLVYSLHP